MAVVLKTSVYRNQPPEIGKGKERAVKSTEPGVEKDKSKQKGKAPTKKAAKVKI